MSAAELEKVTEAWPPISRAVRVPHTDADYRELVELLDRITDETSRAGADKKRFTDVRRASADEHQIRDWEASIRINCRRFRLIITSAPASLHVREPWLPVAALCVIAA